MNQCIEEDNEYEKENDAFFEKNCVSSTESDYQNGEKMSRNGRPFLPEMKQSSTLFVASRDFKVILINPFSRKTPQYHILL